MGSIPALCIIFWTQEDWDGWNLEIGGADGCIKRTESSSYYIWQYFTVSNSSDHEKGGAKIAVCKFCDNTFSASGCCTSRAAAHILRRSVLGQANAIKPSKCLKSTQQALDEVMQGKEAGKKRKQAVMYELLGTAARRCRAIRHDTDNPGHHSSDARLLDRRPALSPARGGEVGSCPARRPARLGHGGPCWPRFLSLC